MQRTKSKLLSILLSLVMLLSLVPAMGVTALAAAYYSVGVNGIELRDGYYLENNSSEKAKTGAKNEPTAYVAWYKNGVLTLRNFTGKANSNIKVLGADTGDLTIKLFGDNTITAYETGIQGSSSGDSITITADSGSNGKLTINVTNSDRPVFGINGYANSVTIKGYADVAINATTTATNRESYGIKSSKAVSILDSASVSITCNTPNSTSRSDSCNGIFSEKDVTIDTDGTIQIDVSKAGDEARSYGINSMNALTLTKVGEMTVRGKKNSLGGAPLLPSSASFDSKAYDTDVTIVTNEDGTKYYIATYTPKGATADISVSNWPDPTAFPSEDEGYALAQGRVLTISNKGAADTGPLTITVEGANPKAFTVSPNKISNIAAGEKAEPTVRPANGLPAGIYTATLKISGKNVNTLSINVQFTVKDVTSSLIGDVNKDGAINGQDLQRLYEHLKGENPLPTEDVSLGDVNGDSDVNGQDWQRLYEHVKGEKLLT